MFEEASKVLKLILSCDIFIILEDFLVLLPVAIKLREGLDY
jgi:hypothetical protein